MNLIRETKNATISLKKNAFWLLVLSFFVNIFLIFAIIYFANAHAKSLQSSFIQNITAMNSMNYFLNNLTNNERVICLLIFISFFVLAIIFLFVSIRTIWLSSRVEELFESSRKYYLFVFSIIAFIFPIIIFQIILLIQSSKVKRDIFNYYKKNEEKNIKTPTDTLTKVPVVTSDIIDDKKIETPTNTLTKVPVVTSNNIDDKKIDLDEISKSSNSCNINSLRKELLILKEMLDSGEISYKEYLQLKDKVISSI